MHLFCSSVHVSSFCFFEHCACVSAEYVQMDVASPPAAAHVASGPEVARQNSSSEDWTVLESDEEEAARM